MVGKNQYKEFRADGWPLCPNCGEDELYSHLSWTDYDDKPAMSDYIKDGLQCYRCQWQSSEIRKPYTIKIKGMDKLIKAFSRIR